MRTLRTLLRVALACVLLFCLGTCVSFVRSFDPDGGGSFLGGLKGIAISWFVLGLLWHETLRH